MKPFFPLAGMLLVAFLAFGTGCAEDDGLFNVGGGGTKKATPGNNASPGSGATPSPSGSGFGGGVR